MYFLMLITPLIWPSIDMPELYGLLLTGRMASRTLYLGNV